MTAASLRSSFNSFCDRFLDQCCAGRERGVGEHLHDRDHGTFVVVACPRNERSAVPIKDFGERTSFLQLPTIGSGWDHTPLVREGWHHLQAIARKAAFVAWWHEE